MHRHMAGALLVSALVFSSLVCSSTAQLSATDALKQTGAPPANKGSSLMLKKAADEILQSTGPSESELQSSADLPIQAPNDSLQAVNEATESQNTIEASKALELQQEQAAAQLLHEREEEQSRQQMQQPMAEPVDDSLADTATVAVGEQQPSGEQVHQQLELQGARSVQEHPADDTAAGLIATGDEEEDAMQSTSTPAPEDDALGQLPSALPFRPSKVMHGELVQSHGGAHIAVADTAQAPQPMTEDGQTDGQGDAMQAGYFLQAGVDSTEELASANDVAVAAGQPLPRAVPSGKIREGDGTEGSRVEGRGPGKLGKRARRQKEDAGNKAEETDGQTESTTSGSTRKRRSRGKRLFNKRSNRATSRRALVSE